MIHAEGTWLMCNGEICDTAVQFEFEKPPVYEVIRLIDGLPLFFEAHMDRLERSFELIGEHPWLSRSEIAMQIRILVQKEQHYNTNLRLEMGRDRTGTAHTLLFFSPTSYPEKLAYSEGVRVTLDEFVRETPQAKIFRKQYAEHVGEIRKNTGAFEVLLHDENGKLSEGSRSNLFFIKRGALYSARSADILQGISRVKIIACVNALGIPLIEKDIFLDELDDFSACFLSGTSLHMLPISAIDKHRYASADDVLFKQVSKAFMAMVEEDLNQMRRQYA